MIQKIKIRFIAVAMTALLVLLALIVSGMNIFNYNSIIRDADIKLELLSQNKGRFPEFLPDRPRPLPSNMTQETPYELRYFSVLLTSDGKLVQTDTSRIKAIDSTSAVQYATKILKTGKKYGFLENYRFISVAEDNCLRILFLDCSREVFSFRLFLISSICMALVGYLFFFFVILFFSNRITNPITESYEKQKRFITDAGHEIKTPLAIIKADVDVLEMEYGENEWLDGIQAQVKRLSDLTSDLVYLSRMEEAETQLQMIDFPFSDVVFETAQAFHAMAQAQEKTFRCHVEPMLSLNGNEKSIRQLVNILLDNAMKYTPKEGFITLTAQMQNHCIQLSVINTTANPIEKHQLSHIFDRFYRMDSSRSNETGGYGIGLSVAKAIVTAHNGKITASMQECDALQITVQFPI